MKPNVFLRASLGAVAVSLMHVAPVLAQTTGDGASSIQEIIVTAQKREQTLQDTPLAISAVTGDEIAKKAQGSLDAVLKSVSGVEVQNLAQGAQVYIRGVGSSIDPSFADPSIALMIDGAYNGRTEAVQSAAYDIERIEVLRGPQGTLYGRNASGGLINVLTRDPSLTDGLGGYWQVQFGNYDLVRSEGAVNAPVSNDIAVRVAGYREKRDGYVDDGSYDSDSWGVRGKILVEPTSWLKIVAKADIYRARGHGANTVPVPGSVGNLTFPPPYFTIPVVRFPDGWQQNNPGDPWSNNPEYVPGSINRKSETYSAQIDADLGFATLTVLPSYTRSKNTLTSNFLFGSILPFTGPTYTINENYDTITSDLTYKSVEARLSSHAGTPLQYVVGLYYLKSDPNGFDVQTTGTTLEGEPYVLHNIFAPGETIAAFGQLTYSITERFRVTGGLRWSRDKSGQAYAIDINDSTQAYEYSQKQTSTQYKVGLEYDLTPKSLLYAHVATGFKQGGVSPTFPSIEFKPEKLTAFEIGSKNTFFGNRLQLNVAAFHYDYRDYQYSTLESLNIGDRDDTATFSVVHNAGKATINGAEASIEFVPWRNGRLTASMTYLDATYGNAILPNNPFVNQGEVNLQGSQMQNSPDWAGNIGFEQGFEMGSGMLTIGANSHLTTSYYVSPEQYLPGAHQKGFTRSDARLRYEIDGFSIGVSVQNIENKAQTTAVFPAYRRFISAPRTVIAQLGYKF